MQFTDIKNKIYFLTSTNSSDFPVADLTAEANNALDRVVSLINEADGRWQWDDSNQTDLPIATASLVSGQRDYLLTTAHLRIADVQVKDTSGNWYPLKPIDPQDDTSIALETTYGTSGLPEKYDVLGNSLYLYPASNYSQSASLKIYYQRGPSYFATSDTSKEPGFASIFHELVPLWVAYNYAIANGKQNAPLLLAQIDRKEKELLAFYSHRDKDDSQEMTMAPIRFR